jgi:radical SAM protein with 4Fe4S-binding SPASM domain
MMPNGDFYPSSEFFGQRDWLVGNGLKDDLREIWNDSSVLNRIRPRQLPNRCQPCRHAPVCGGGLLSRPLLNKNGSGEPDDCPLLCGEWSE